MELIAQRGLPVEAQATGTPDLVAHAAKPEVQAPLTTGFARTGFELTVIEAREQKLEYGKGGSGECGAEVIGKNAMRLVRRTR